MADISSILINLGGSIDAIQELVSWTAYVFGLMLFFIGINKFAKLADKKQGSSRGGAFIPMAYIFGASLLLFLPTFVDIARNSLFGLSSPLAYDAWFRSAIGEYGQADFVVMRLVQTAGIIWFVRGTVLVVQSSEPGGQHGPKGFVFLIAGVFAMNFQYTIDTLETLITYLPV